MKLTRKMWKDTFAEVLSERSVPIEDVYYEVTKRIVNKMLSDKIREGKQKAER